MDIEEILYTFEDDYNPSSKVPGPRNMYNQGQLVQPNADGSRPGYNGDRKTVHLINETGNPNHSGIYKTTNTKTGSVSYRGGYTRRDEGGRQSTKSSSTIKGARELLDKALETPKGKSMIDLQAEKGAGNLLNDKKFINQLEKAFEEVSALEKKGYGNIDKIVKKYETKFYKKVGTKNIDGSTVKKGTENVFTKTLRSEIREYAKDLDIYNVENPNMEKALNDYRKIKNPKKGMIVNIAERYGIKRNMLDNYITNLGQRKYIPIKDPDEYTKAIRAAEKKALKKFSDRYFERVLQAPMTSGEFFADAADDEVVRLQKSHLGDKLTQDVKTSNIGYAAQEINQEVLKEVDTEMRQLNKKLANLYKNKPKGYLQEMDKLNQRGNDLAAATKGYKKFTGLDPYTGKEFTINFSSAAQELDPTELLGEDTKLANIDKQDKATVKNLKATAMKNASKTKAQVSLDIEEIKKNIADLGCPKSLQKASGGRIKYSTGSSCPVKGEKKLNKLLFEGGGTTTERNLVQKIISGGGKMALSMLNPRELIRLSNLVGPAALGLMGAYEVGSITDDVLRLNKPLDEALAGNWLTKSFLPYSEEFAKQKNLLQSGQLTGDQKEYALEMMKMENFIKEGKRIEGLESNKLVEGTLDDDFTFTSDKDMNKAYRDLFGRFSRLKPYAYEQGITGRSLENEAAMNEYIDAQTARTGASKVFGGPQPMVNKAPRPKNMGRGPMTEKGRMNLDFSIPGYTPYDKAYTPTDEEVLNIYKQQGYVHPRFGQLEPGEGTKVRMGLASQGDNRSIYGSKFMEGGIASLNVKK